RPEKRAEQPGVDGQCVGVAVVAGGHVDPEAGAVVLAREQRRDLRRGQHARLGPGAVVDAPTMLAAALGPAAIGERDSVELTGALRKLAADARLAAVDRGQRVADAQVAHALAARRRSDSRIERLRLAHARPPRDDDEVRRLEPRRLEVELFEARGDAG